MLGLAGAAVAGMGQVRARASWGGRELGRCMVRAAAMATVRVGARLGLAREGGGVGKEAREERNVDKVLHATQVEEPERTEGRCAPRSGNGPDTAGAANAADWPRLTGAWHGPRCDMTLR